VVRRGCKGAEGQGFIYPAKLMSWNLLVVKLSQCSSGRQGDASFHFHFHFSDVVSLLGVNDRGQVTRLFECGVVIQRLFTAPLSI